MAILDEITANNVFDFMRTKTDLRANSTPAIESLIKSMAEEVKRFTGREIESQTATDLILQNNLNSIINLKELLLLPPFTDFYDITSMKEFGTEIQPVLTFGDGNEFIYDNKGKITKILGIWSSLDASIQISGKFGFVNVLDDSTRDDVKQIIIEMVSAKSGLWTINVEDEDGTIQTIRTNISSGTQKRLDKMVLPF